MKILNILLQNAKESRRDYELAKISYPVGDKRRNNASRIDREVWDTLYKQICRSVPLIMVGEDGENLVVGTGGNMVNRSFFHYSDEINAPQTLLGYDLLCVDRFESRITLADQRFVFGVSNLDSLKAAYGNLTAGESTN